MGRAIGSILTGNVTFNDSAILRFGTGNDVTISYDGTNFLINPAAVGSGEFRVGTTSNYFSVQADGDARFQGTSTYRVPNNTAAFVSDTFVSAGLFFSTNFGGSFEFRDASGARCASIPIDQAAIFDYGVAYTENTPATLTGNVNNYALIGQGGFARMSSDASRNVTGIVAPADGQGGKILLIVNVGAQNIVFTHQDANSTDVNRIIGIAGANTTVTAGQNAGLIYDTTTNRWRIMYAQ